MLSLQKCNTIQDLVTYGYQLPISHGKLHYKKSFTENNDILIINFNSILDKYWDYLQKIVVPKTLNDVDYNKYKFQPKRLSFEIYGTTELWSAILRINQLTSASQFTKQTINLFTMDIFEVLNEILILENTHIKENNKEIGL